MKKVLLHTVAAVGFAASASAADLGDVSLKDPLPDTLTWHGVTLYGTVDVGYAYQTNGAPSSGALYTGLDYNMYGSKQNREAISSLTNSALSQSFVGLKVEEAIGYGVSVVAKLESGFNPISGELADACASLVRNNGKPLNQMNSSGDGSRCGQAINGQGFAGLSSSQYGTLTLGRQNSLVLDAMSQYDPMGLSYAFSLIGWSGGAGSGVGSTETARWDNSVKYVLNYGPVHAGAMYANGAEDSSIQNHAAAGDVGLSWKGFSIDALYTYEGGAFNASAPASTAPVGTVAPAGALWTGVVPYNALSGNFQDNTAWDVMAKYTFNVGSPFGLKDGGYKDGPFDPSGKVTIYGGYQHTDISNPAQAISGVNNTTIGGYPIYASSFAAANSVFTTDRILQTEWAGLKYEPNTKWSFTGAWYRITQDAYTKSGVACPVSHAGGTATPGNCAGESNTASFLVDYVWNKHLDLYGGVAWSNILGGLSNGYLATENTTVTTGLRLKF